MLFFRFNFTLTEEDYLAFNSFHNFESHYGKHQSRRFRTVFIVMEAVIATVILLLMGITTFSLTYVIVTGLFCLFYMLFYKKISCRGMKKNLERMKKMGKLHFDPACTVEFYEDKVVEITPTTRHEQRYEVFERVCVVDERYILLYSSSSSAHIFPIPQVRAQANQDVFLGFLSQKCPVIDYH